MVYEKTCYMGEDSASYIKVSILPNILQALQASQLCTSFTFLQAVFSLKVLMQIKLLVRTICVSIFFLAKGFFQLKRDTVMTLF